MEPWILVGTADGLWRLAGAGPTTVDALTGREVTALAGARARAWAIVDGREIWAMSRAARDEEPPWERVATVEGPAATCLAPTPVGFLVGTEEAHLLRFVEGRLSPVESFDRAEGREAWYTPWGDPADVRSIAFAPPPIVPAASAEAVVPPAAVAPGPLQGSIYVNVHVGGVVRSRDGGGSWTPTLDIETDVHQVLVHPPRPEVVLVAAAVGLGISRDGGDSWEFVTEGLHARYARAVAVTEDAVLLTASTGPGGKRAAVYRRPLAGAAAFERCRQGLPTWFDDNIDTACFAAAGPVAVFGAEDGRIYRSADAGATWDLLAKGLPAVRCLILG